MTAPIQLHLGLNPAHHNQYLFSDHYLNHLLPDDPRWPAALPEAEAFLTWVRQLYAAEHDHLSHYSEAQLEEHWIRPILRQMGHVYEPQAGLPGLEHDVKRPDYVFFPDEATRKAASGLQKTQEYAVRALAVAEVKVWDRDPNKKQPGGQASFEAQNPSWQIDYYVRASGMSWGVLSNGRQWRLVHKDSSQRLYIYYEVDLAELLIRGDAGALRYFTLFFGQAAFRPDGEGRVFLADALAASSAYAVELEEDLQRNAFRALERLMQGFLDLAANQVGPEDMHQVYDNSLYLLYRLLFILYAESRGLLPMRQEAYREQYSLHRLEQDIAGLGTPPAPMATRYWGQLKQLFQIINGDNPQLNAHLGVPRYNGGLFDPHAHPFLDEKQVGDRALVDAINLLALRDSPTGRESVDYRTLGVRQLGSVYEGLLEFQPRYAHEPMVAIRDHQGERWTPAGQAPAGARIVERREAGQVFLSTDRGERKATGSYYTPQYIVEYIVRNTLGPLVSEAVERVKARGREARGKAARERAARSLVDEILNLKVLDPAMGSGHFLVEATEFLALALASDPYVETDVAAEEDLAYWKRRVVERCIYGVDKNPLAVELAKLSLWLSTVALDRPLSFLDHHLKCGDSLVGARAAQLETAPFCLLSKKEQTGYQERARLGARQVSLFEQRLSEALPVVMGRILEITDRESDSYEAVQAKEAADQAVSDLKAPFEAVANLWTSAYFGHAFSVLDYDQALGMLRQPAELLALPAVRQARAIAGERRFFHWEIAFPEVFYDRNGQPLVERAGFDAVVGNPPYVRVRTLKETGEPSVPFLESGVYSCAVHVWDIYMLMLERSQSLAKPGGYCSFIVPIQTLHQPNAESLRSLLLQKGALYQVIDLSELEVFRQAIVKTCILVYGPVLEHKDSVTLMRVPRTSSIDNAPALTVNRSTLTAMPGRSFKPTIVLNSELLARIDGVSEPLGSLFYVTFGLRSCAPGKGGGRKDRLILETESSPAARPYMEGREIDRYADHWAGRYVDYLPDRMYSPRSASIFEVEKIVSQSMLSEKRIVATLDEEHRYVEQSLVCIVAHTRDVGAMTPSSVDLRYVLAILNSLLCSFYFATKVIGDSLGGGLIHATPGSQSQLPIRRIAFTTPDAQRARLTGEGLAETRAWLEAEEKRAASGCFAESRLGLWLHACLSAQPEQADIVHDLLAHLAEQMIAMNRQKQAATERFWLDLQGVTGPDVFHKLHDKGKQESSLWKEGACRPFVRELSGSSRSLDDSLPWNEEAFKAFVRLLTGELPGLSKMVSVYRDHSPAYRALVARLQATDRLIDQIVYQLYGLTEDEIAIVEGNVR